MFEGSTEDVAVCSTVAGQRNVSTWHRRSKLASVESPEVMNGETLVVLFGALRHARRGATLDEAVKALMGRPGYWNARRLIEKVTGGPLSDFERNAPTWAGMTAEAALCEAVRRVGGGAEVKRKGGWKVSR